MTMVLSWGTERCELSFWTAGRFSIGIEAETSTWFCHSASTRGQPLKLSQYWTAGKYAKFARPTRSSAKCKMEWGTWTALKKRGIQGKTGSGSFASTLLKSGKSWLDIVGQQAKHLISDSLCKYESHSFFTHLVETHQFSIPFASLPLRCEQEKCGLVSIPLASLVQSIHFRPPCFRSNWNLEQMQVNSIGKIGKPTTIAFVLLQDFCSNLRIDWDFGIPSSFVASSNNNQPLDSIQRPAFNFINHANIDFTRSLLLKTSWSVLCEQI